MTASLTLVVLGFGGCGSDDAAGERTTTTSTGLSACEDRLIAYFEPAATPEQLEDAEAVIRGVDQVAEVEFFDQDETFAEMQDLFSEASPELLENLDPDDLPSSFRVRVTAVEALDEVEQVLETAPAFREVIRSDETLTPAMEARMTETELWS
jgi:cell division protein FtsX